MSKIAIIKTGGKQYKVKEGQTIKIETLNQEMGAVVKFDTLLVASDDGSDVNVGQPSLGEMVEAKIVELGKDDKINVIKYKAKTRYKRNIGHRQQFAKVEIVSIK